MPSRFKGSIDFRIESWEATLGRIRDEAHPWRSFSEESAAAQVFQQFNGEGLSTPPLLGGHPTSSITEQFYIKDMKYLVHFQNLKTNKIRELVNQFTKDSFASVLEAQRETVALFSEVTEEETKLLSNYTKVHYNAFIRGIDAPLQWSDQTALKDFKTGFAFNQRYLMSSLHDAGLVLPIHQNVEVPILDAYIVDELSDTGDSYIPIELGDPRNLIRKNKTFKYVVIRKENDNTSRRYKRKTSYDNYPHSCESLLTIELELPATTMINYLRLEPIGDSSVSIPPDGLSYKSEDGADISLTTINVPTETAITFLFQPIHTKYLRVTLQQTGTVGRRDITTGNKKVRAFNQLLGETDMQTRLPDDSLRISGRVYDFSLSNIATGLLAFENAGIFRASNAVNVDSPIGFDIVKTVEQITPIEFFDAYLRSVTLPEGRVLFETYLYMRLYGGLEAFEFVPGVSLPNKNKKPSDIAKNTLFVDTLVPLPDTYPLQYEYLEPVIDLSRVKLFPDMLWNAEQKVVSDVCSDTLILDPMGETAQVLFDVWALDLDSTAKAKLKANLEALITPETLGVPNTLALSSFEFDTENDPHVEARTDVESAVRSLTMVARGGNIDKNVELVFVAPSDSDIQDTLGSAWINATEDEKALVRAQPEDYLLTSRGVMFGGSKSLRFNETTTVSFYARTGILPDGYVNKDFWLADALHNTKFLKLTIEDIDTSSDVDTVTISMELVRDEIPIGSSTLTTFTKKNRHLLNNISKIRKLSVDYRNLFLKTTAPNPKTSKTLEAFKKLVSAILGGSVVIQKTSALNGDGESWEEILGSKGSSLFKPVKFAYGVEGSGGDFPYGRSETLASLAADSAGAGNEGLWALHNNYLPGQLKTQKVVASLAGTFPSVELIARKFETTEGHALHVGDVVAFETIPSTRIDGEYRVINIGDGYFYVKYFDDNNVPMIRGIGVSVTDILSKVHNSGFQLPPVEVYENDVLMILGVDYEISLNDGSDWLQYWPVSSAYTSYFNAAKAGRFYIRLKVKRRGAIYWMKYRVMGNQKLSDDEKIYLRNGRVTCDETLRGSSGTIQTVIIARTRSANPYLTPLMRNYSLRIQEQPLVQRSSGRLSRERLRKTRRRSTLNVG